MNEDKDTDEIAFLSEITTVKVEKNVSGMQGSTVSAGKERCARGRNKHIFKTNTLFFKKNYKRTSKETEKTQVFNKFEFL